MTMPERHAALLFAIGPVQDFIATARKGQDFWFGSWLLSELSRTAASAAFEHGAQLILPAPESLRQGDAVANKLVARVRSQDAEGVAGAMETAVRERLMGLAGRVFELLQKAPEGRHLHRASAERQVADLLEVYWVAVDEAAGDWGESRRRAEAALAARKSLRDFGPVGWGAPVPKSRLDGQRESVIDERAYSAGTDARRAERLRRSFGIGPAERLCGVGLLKRNGHLGLTDADARGARVISTSHVASWSLRRAWADDGPPRADLRRTFEDYIAALPDSDASLPRTPPTHVDPVLGRVDGQILYFDRLAELYEGTDLEAARAALSNFLRAARTIVESSGARWPILSPYYAILRADGDHMGAWLDSLATPDDHQRASQALGAFSRQADRIVAEHHGHCLFAGGDDVLALLPVATALDCAAGLNDAFHRCLREAPRGAVAPTLSAGIQIAHATSPFRDALHGARRAEHAAKEDFGRAAFAVRLDKRSGVPVLVGGRWSDLTGLRNLQSLQEPTDGSLPRGLAYDLRCVADRLHGEAAPLAAIRTLEVDRVLRQKDIRGAGAAAIRSRLGSTSLDGDTLRRVSDELIVTRALAAIDGEDA